jgi:hypothetical protein
MSYQFKEENNSIIALDGDGRQVGEVEYSWEGDKVMVIDHTNIDGSQRGQGLGGQLIAQAVEKAKNEGLKITPVCPYAKKQFEKHEQYQSVLQD